MTWLLVLGVPAGFALIGLCVLNSIDGWLDYWKRSRSTPWMNEDFPMTPSTIGRTLDEIRRLPETPFDWEREQAV